MGLHSGTAKDDRPITIEARISTARLSLGLSQGEVARQLGIAPTTLSRYESGTRLPDAHMMARLAEVLHTTVGELIEGHKSEGSGSSILQFVAERPDLYRLAQAAQVLTRPQVGLFTSFLLTLGSGATGHEEEDE